MSGQRPTPSYDHRGTIPYALAGAATGTTDRSVQSQNATTQRHRGDSELAGSGARPSPGAVSGANQGTAPELLGRNRLQSQALDPKSRLGVSPANPTITHCSRSGHRVLVKKALRPAKVPLC